MALLQCISTNLAPNHPKDSLKKKNLACIQSYCFNGALIKKKIVMPIFFWDIISLELAMQTRLALNSKILAAGAGVKGVHHHTQHANIIL